MNIQLPGRKATIAGAVITTMLVFIGQGMFDGMNLIIVLGMITFITVAYTFANVWQKVILPVEIDPSDDDGDLGVSIGNIHAEMERMDKVINLIHNRIPPAAGEGEQ